MLTIGTLSSPVIALATSKNTLHIGVSANFRPVMEQVIVYLQQSKDFSNPIKPSYASTSKLYNQISNGAPFDLYISASRHHPRQLIEQQHAPKQPLTLIANGQLVLWSKQPKSFTKLLKDWKNNENNGKIVIANPNFAPFGLATKTFLQANNLWKPLNKHFINSDNIAQAFQYLTTGLVDYAFVSLSQIKDYNNKHPKKTITNWHTITNAPEIPIILLKLNQHPATEKFYQILKSAPIQKIIRQSGYKSSA